MDNPFESLPLTQHIRKLRAISGGSTQCGWMWDEDAFLLYALVKYFKPQLVVQTGHLWGKSALAVLEAVGDGFLMGQSSIEESPQNADPEASAYVERNSPIPAGRPPVVSIDPEPKGVPHTPEGVQYIKTLHPNFEFFKEGSADFFRENSTRLKKEFANSRIIGIVDGDHSVAGCLVDLCNLHELGAQMIFVDDTTWIPHIGRTARLFAEREGYGFINLPFYTGTGLLYRKSYFQPVTPRAGQRFFVPQMVFYLIGGRWLLNFTRRLKRALF